MEQAKRFFIIFLILCGTACILLIAITNEIGKHRYIESSYFGIVKEKVYKPNHAGMPNVLIDSTWHYFGIREVEGNTIVEVGDSIVKRSGTSRILLYRKDSSGFWVEVPPDNPYEKN